jgi:outer membrane protein assembly factor BamA
MWLIKPLSSIFCLCFCICLLPIISFSQTVIAFHTDTADLVTRNEEKIRIDKIFITGNEKTKDYVIRREIDLHEGEVIKFGELEEMLLKDRQRIFNTRLFQKVETTAIPISDNLYDIIFEVSERWYAVPSPILKFVDRNFMDWWKNHNLDFSRVNYGGKFTHYNFRGRREKLSLGAQFGYTRSLHASYHIPYIDKSRINGLGFTIQYAEYKNIPLHTRNHYRRFIDVKDDDVNMLDGRNLREVYNAGVYFTRRPSFYNTHTVMLSFFANHIADPVLERNPYYLLTGNNSMRYFQLGYNFRRDMRDVFAYPLKGFMINVEATKRGLGIYNDVNLFSTTATYNHHVPLSKRLFFSNSFNGRISTPQKQPYLLLTGLGYGPFYVRGFEEYVIEGQHYLLNKTELKFELFKEDIALGRLMPLKQFSHFPFAVYPKILFDVGYVMMPDSYSTNDFLANKPIWSLGTGLDFVSFYDMVMRLEISRTSLRQNVFGLHFTAGI